MPITKSAAIDTTAISYERQVPIRKSHYQCPYTSDRVQGSVFVPVTVPLITLEGDWLKEAGFKCNRNVVITVSKDCLMITPEPKNQRPK